jgi:hypothetical protein
MLFHVVSCCGFCPHPIQGLLIVFLHLVSCIRFQNSGRAIAKVFFICGILCAVQGCTGPASTAMMGVEAVSIINTDKTITDHVVSMARDQDCSSIRAQNGDYYCIPYYENQQKPAPQPYCYRTMAGVDCYQQPLKNGNDIATVQIHADENTQKRKQ